ncbi:hypothetical protein I4U23_003868 [Adineta vaga]|nr:hypothetical protein I4U23_003868 [Adineta vaga]
MSTEAVHPESLDWSNQSPCYSGGCQCGAIRYAIYSCSFAQPVEICHCRMCQKALGAAFGVFVCFKMEDFRWTRGIPSSFQSSSMASRVFCSHCGTPLAYKLNYEPLIQLLLGSFDRPQQFGKPEVQIGIESCMGEWAKVKDVKVEKTTEEADGLNTSKIINYQHPDYDTPEWPIDILTAKI